MAEQKRRKRKYKKVKPVNISKVKTAGSNLKSASVNKNLKGASVGAQKFNAQAGINISAIRIANFKKMYSIKSHKKFRSSKTFVKQMAAINRRFQRFDEANLSANDVNMFKKMIKAFNIRAGFGESEEFDTKKWYTKEQQKEIRALMAAIRADPETTLNYWRETYKKIKELGLNEEKDVNLNFFKKVNEKFNFESEQDFINFSDTMKRYSSSDIIGKILDSDQYRDLVEMADDTGYSEENDIDELIIKEYERTGKTFVNLYNHVFDILTMYERYGTTNVDEDEE